MQARSIFKASLCPGCGRPLDVCAAEFTAGRAYVVDEHICTVTRVREIQSRMTEWENTDRDKRTPEPPVNPRWSDGLIHVPHPATADELAN